MIFGVTWMQFFAAIGIATCIGLAGAVLGGLAYWIVTGLRRLIYWISKTPIMWHNWRNQRNHPDSEFM